MLCGHRPFDAESKVALLGMQVTAPVPKMAEKYPEANVPPEVEAIVVHLLAKEATERLGEAKQVVERLATVMTQLAAVGRIDPAYAPSPGSLTNPGLISAISPAPPELLAQQNAAKQALLTPPPSMSPGPLAGKGWLLVVGAGIAFIGVITIVAALLIGRTPTIAGDAGATPTGDPEAGQSSGTVQQTSLDERVKEAIAMIDRGDNASGIKKLEDLGSEVEDREDVHRALFNAYSKMQDKEKEALREAKLWLKANPQLDVSNEDNLRVFVRNQALREGEQKDIADTAFALLEGPMGAAGWDILYDIAFGTSGVNYTKAAERAKRTLLRGDRKKMSEALAITMDLHAVGASCAAKALFDRAADKGDERTSFLLKQWVAPRWIGHFRKQDMLGCIHEGSLTKTIQSIDDRVKTQKKKTP
jgi:serine/threonine-protein kinase